MQPQRSSSSSSLSGALALPSARQAFPTRSECTAASCILAADHAASESHPLITTRRSLLSAPSLTHPACSCSVSPSDPSTQPYPSHHYPMPPRVLRAISGGPVCPSVAVRLHQLSSSYTASWFTHTAKHNHRPLSTQRHTARDYTNRAATTSGLPRARAVAIDSVLSHGIGSPLLSSTSSFPCFAFSSFSSAGSDGSASPPLPRLLSPTLPSDSPTFSLRKWLSRKLGYDKFRPIVRLYASLSEQANSASFTRTNTTAIPACASTVCALLTVHMWVLHSRLRSMASSAWQSGREAEAKQLHANIRLLFNLVWQEMEHVLADEERQQQQQQQEPIDVTLPARYTPVHYTVDDYRQLSYGAMVSYDRAWSQYRETGQRGDMMGALWRNVWTTTVPLHVSNLHALATYVEQAIQMSNRWTEYDITVRGVLRWPVLPVEPQSETSELLRYDSQLYDGSRVRTEESVGVPLRFWGVG